MDDMAFPPPYQEQAKYLELADQFLSGNPNSERDEENVQSIDTIPELDDEKAA